MKASLPPRSALSLPTARDQPTGMLSLASYLHARETEKRLASVQLKFNHSNEKRE